MMERYEIIFKKLDEIQKNDSKVTIKIITQKYSENINELSKLAYEIKNPQPVTFSFS